MYQAIIYGHCQLLNNIVLIPVEFIILRGSLFFSLFSIHCHNNGLNLCDIIAINGPEMKRSSECFSCC